jgi:mannosyltransferase OCH1-like enzyme
MIPKVIHRSVPEVTSGEVENLWAGVVDLHPGWECVTWRDPLDPTMFPLTSPSWPLCQSGAQLAGLVRLELLLTVGGVWLDSDVEMFRPLDPLVGVEMFAGWEDPGVVPDAVLGARPDHPAVRECLRLALERLHSPSQDWRSGNGAWSTGPGVTTQVLPGRSDVLLLPPGSFYPVHYSDKGRARWSRVASAHPWAFGAHRWHASWLQA